MLVDARVRWGLAGLMAFEALVVARTFSTGNWTFAAIYFVGALLLAYALWRATRGEAPSFVVLAGLALDSLLRAYLQTNGDFVPTGVYPTYLVPLGFAVLAVESRRPSARLALVGIVLVAIARTWFVYWYFGNATLVLANLAGAIGAWAWASALLGASETPRAAPA